MSNKLQINQFSQTPLKGAVAALLNDTTISAQIDPASIATLYAGSRVKLTTAVGSTILIDKCANADEGIGFIPYTPKKDTFVAGDPVEICLSFSILWMEASGAVARGEQLEGVATGDKVKTNAGNPVCGIALDNASDGDIFRVLVLVPFAIPATITSGSINGVAIGGSVPASGKFTSLATVVTALTPGLTVSVNPALGGVFTLTPGENETINAASVIAGQTLTVIILTSGASSFDLDFVANFIFAGTLATGVNDGKYFVIEFVSDGTNYIEKSRTAAL